MYSKISQPILELRNVSKTYQHNAARAFLHTWVRSLFRDKPEDSFHALKNVSLHLERGEGLAVIGPNGAGKSTLLGLIAGISFPDEGSLEVNGSVAALLELGSGFHPDLSGRENVFLNAALLGLSRKDTTQRYDEIVEFSGIGDFIKEPLRTYSTGMVMRLAFSVVVNVDPEILIIDEAFAVGDQDFQKKCIDRILKFKRDGKTMICVSHAMQILEQFCDRALWLDHGQAVMDGRIGDVIEAYEAGRTKGRAVRV